MLPAGNIAGLFQEKERAVRYMMRNRRILQNLVKEKGKSRFAVSHNALCPAESRQRRCPFIAMQIDDQIEVFFSKPQNKAKKAAKMVVRTFLVDEQAFIKMPIVLHQVRQLLVRQQGNPRPRISRPQGSKHRCDQHQVSQMHEIDDKNILVQGC